MNFTYIKNTLITIISFFCAASLIASTAVPVPKGFEDIFDARQQGIFEVLYGDLSLGTFSVDFDRQDVLLLSPIAVAEQIFTADATSLTLSQAALLSALSAPLKRLSADAAGDSDIGVMLDESNATLRVILPANLFRSDRPDKEKSFIPYQSNPGFVHAHNLNYLADSYGDNLSLSASETLNFTGNTYLRSAWSYARDTDFSLEELALYLEHKNQRFKMGRQRLSDNLITGTPSASYSFFNPVSFDGIALGYMGDNYLSAGTGAASPVTIYLPQAGTVEVYRQGRMIDIQQFPAGLQHLDTASWPAGGYDVLLVSRLINGAREEKSQPFFKRNGTFHSGEVEYILQFGRYDPRQGALLARTKAGINSRYNISNHLVSNVSLAWTSPTAFSVGGGLLTDDNRLFASSSLDIPINSWFAERLYADGIYGDQGSRGYQLGAMKNLYRLGLNFSYRDYLYKGDEEGYRRFGVVPAWDFESWQFGATTFIPGNIGLSLSYGLNTFYQQYGRENKSAFKSWDINLNRDFSLADSLNLRVDVGYHHGINEYVGRYNYNNTTEDRIYAQLTLGMRERSFDHYQALHVRTRLSDDHKNNYGADYALNLDNPAFDRASRYVVNASVNRSADDSNNIGAGASIDNRFGSTSVGVSQSFGTSDYRQHYLSQRGGFAVGGGEIAFGKMENAAALIVDASTLPRDQFFEVRNRSNEPVIIKGGQKTTLSMTPYQKIAPKAEQLFTVKNNAFYTLKTTSPSTWAMPGQVYHVRLAATQNLTVTGRLYLAGRPLANARVVGANAMTDEEGLFVGDYQLESHQQLNALSVQKDGQAYLCPLIEQEIKMTQGVMQIREVNCEIE